MPNDRILGLKEVTRRILYSRSHIYRLQKDGKFPALIKLGPGRVGVSELELSEWIDAHKDQRER